MFELGTDGPSVVVVGVDGSDSSLRAAAYGWGLARRQGSKLVLAYVQPSGPGPGSPEMGAAMVDLGRETASDLERQIREGAERGTGAGVVRWEFHTLQGDPYRALLELADRLRADAVVIGASQKAGHKFMGSVAVRLVKAGRWPVTVVP